MLAHLIVHPVFRPVPLLAAALTLGACTLTSAQLARDDLDQLARAADERVVDLERLAASLPEGTPEQIEAQHRLDAWRERQQTLSMLVARADETLAEAANPTDPLTRTADAVSAWLPEPAGAPLVLAAALVATLARARQLKKGSLSIARSLDRAMEQDPALRELVASQANTLRSIQTPTARRIVDEAAAERRMLRLPI